MSTDVVTAAPVAWLRPVAAPAPSPRLVRRPPGRSDRRSVRRRGISSLLAMLYLVVFASLALGFYAQTNMSVQVSNNERRMKEALMAAECGLQFIRLELSKTTIPALYPPLTDDQVFEELQMDLKGQLEAGANLEDGATVGDIIYDQDATDGVTPPYFELPADGRQYVRITETGPYFRVRIAQQGRDVVVTAIGKSASTVTSSAGSRAGVEVRFRAQEWPNPVFGFGMASPNQVNITTKNLITGTPDSQASILSTYTGGTPVSLGNTSATSTNPAGTEGNITLMQGAPNPSYVGTAYTVGGMTTSTAINNSITRLSEPPEWPTPDISVFAKYATERYAPGKTTYDNIYIDPLYTPTVTFDGTQTLRGVVLLKPGVNVTFNGQVTMQCVVVGEPGGLLATNVIKFEGNGKAKEPLSSLPDEPKFAELRNMDGTFIVAPNWDVYISGSFVSAAGSIAAGRITVQGNAPATLTGSLVSLGNYPLTIGGNSTLSLNKGDPAKRPGLKFTERFAPVKSSYKEVPPPKEPAPAPAGGESEPVVPVTSEPIV